MKTIFLYLYIAWTQFQLGVYNTIALTSIGGSIYCTFGLSWRRESPFIIGIYIVTLIVTVLAVIVTMKRVKLVKNGVYIVGTYQDIGPEIKHYAEHVVTFCHNKTDYIITFDKFREYHEEIGSSSFLIIDDQKPTEYYICIPEKKWNKLKKHHSTEKPHKAFGP